MSLVLFYLNFYILKNWYFQNKELSILLFWFFILFFLWIFWIQFSFYLKDLIKYKNLKKKLTEIIKEKELWLLNSGKLIELKQASMWLKFELNINDKNIKTNYFKNNLNIIKNNILNNIELFKNKDSKQEQYLNYILKTSLDWKINWYHTQDILEEFDKEPIFIILDYVTYCLKNWKTDSWEKFKKENFNEENKINLFLSYKKALEKRYNNLLKEEKKKKIKKFDNENMF